jgi:hypothetical protein
MLRAVGWAVLLVVGTAAPAAANGHGAHGIAAARQQGTATRGVRPFVAERTTPVQVINGRNGAHLILRAPIGGLWRDVVDQEPRLTLPMPARRERGGSPELPSVSAGKPTLGLPVSNSPWRSATSTWRARTDGAPTARPDRSTTTATISSWAWPGGSDHAALGSALDADPWPPDAPAAFSFRPAHLP